MNEHRKTRNISSTIASRFDSYRVRTRLLAELAERLGDGAPKKPSAAQRPIQNDDTTEPKESGSTEESEAQRQEQRRQRQQRRQQRQRALQKSTST